MSIVDLDSAVRHLSRGELVAIPTETVYGLAARIDDEAALRAIFATKRRPFFDPLIVHVRSADEARGLAAAWGPVEDDLAARFWPGPLTLVVKRAAGVSDLITAGHDTVGLRCPRHPVALELLDRVGEALAAPSANMFGRTSPTTAAHVEAEFGGRVAVVDGGPCDVGVESTVISVDEGAVRVLRPGGVSLTELERALGELGHRRTVALATSNRSPGHTEAHYRPANPLVLVAPAIDDAGVLARVRAFSGRDDFAWLTLAESPELAARTLYAEMRRLSERPGVLLVRTPAAGTGWEAILDRLRRAAVQSWT